MNDIDAAYKVLKGQLKEKKASLNEMKKLNFKVESVLDQKSLFAIIIFWISYWFIKLYLKTGFAVFISASAGIIAVANFTYFAIFNVRLVDKEVLHKAMIPKKKIEQTKPIKTRVRKITLKKIPENKPGIIFKKIHLVTGDIITGEYIKKDDIYFHFRIDGIIKLFEKGLVIRIEDL